MANYIPWEKIAFEPTDDGTSAALFKMGLSILPPDVAVDVLANCNMGFFEGVGSFIHKCAFEKHLILISCELKSDPNQFIMVFLHEVGHFHYGHQPGPRDADEEANADLMRDQWLEEYASYYLNLTDDEREGFIPVVRKGDENGSTEGVVPLK